jgi:hypothetical protein
MPRTRLEIPTYRKRRGRGAVTVYRADGSRTEIVLPGKYGSQESKGEYQALLARLRVADGKLPDEPHSKPGMTISELGLRGVFLCSSNPQRSRHAAALLDRQCNLVRNPRQGRTAH